MKLWVAVDEVNEEETTFSPFLKGNAHPRASVQLSQKRLSALAGEAPASPTPASPASPASHVSNISVRLAGALW